MTGQSSQTKKLTLLGKVSKFQINLLSLGFLVSYSTGVDIPKKNILAGREG